MKRIHIYDQPPDGHSIALNGEYIDGDADTLRALENIFKAAADKCYTGKSSNQLRDEMRARVSQAYEKKPIEEVDLGNVASQIMRKIHVKVSQIGDLQKDLDALNGNLQKLRTCYAGLVNLGEL